MIFLKLKYHIVAAVKKLGYHLLFDRRVSFGRRTTFRSGFHLMVEGTGQIKIGERCFFNHDCSINCLNKITIGSGTIFGEGVRIYDHNHRFSDAAREIKAQGYNLSVSTYVEQEDRREVIDIRQLNRQIEEIVAREAVLRSEIDKIIAEIEG